MSNKQYQNLLYITLILIVGLSIIFFLPNLTVFQVLLIQQTVMSMPVLIFLYQQKISLTNLGLNQISILKTIKSVLIYYSFIIFILTILSLLIHYIGIDIYFFQKQTGYEQLFENLNIYQTILIAVLIAPIIEELLFRGLIFYQFKNFKKSSNLIQSFIFAIAHLQFNALIPLFIIGLILGNLKLKYNSIYPCILLHAFNNGVSLYMMYNIDKITG